MNTSLDNRTPWPFKPMPGLASDAPGAPPLAKRTDPRRRLTQEEKNRIFELHRQGMSNVAIGKEIGCTDVAVGYALKKRHQAQHKTPQQAADVAQAAPAIEMYENPQQDTWEWFAKEHPGAAMRVEVAGCDVKTQPLIDSFLRGYMLCAGLNMDSRDSIIADYHANYLGL